MPVRVLLVDDDQMLLSSMERCLGLQFELVTAQSGLEALRTIEESGPFPVVISDMQMPVMDGLQFIERARQLSESSVFMMLTGNQDVQTAIRAVNEGSVFRFLNKPTDPEDIALAIESAARQHELETAERELLNKTFVGAVALFADMMELLDPELLGRAGRTVQLVEQLRERLNAPACWELQIAAKLALVGAAIKFSKEGAERDLADSKTLVAVCETSARLVERIPRLNRVASILRATAGADGNLDVTLQRGEGDTIRGCAALLRLAGLVEALSFNGVAAAEAEAEIHSRMPDLADTLLRAAVSLYPTDVSPECVAVKMEDLRVGMVVHRPLDRPDGSTLLRAGHRLNETHIERLREMQRTTQDFHEVTVTAASFQAHCDQVGDADAALA